LPGSRLENVGADLFTKGVIDPRRIAPLDHVGQVRYLEAALYTPYKKLLLDEVESRPTQVYQTSAAVECENWNDYLPDPTEIVGVIG
jgi:hypothetical protein